MQKLTSCIDPTRFLNRYVCASNSAIQHLRRTLNLLWYDIYGMQAEGLAERGSIGLEGCDGDGTGAPWEGMDVLAAKRRQSLVDMVILWRLKG